MGQEAEEPIEEYSREDLENAFREAIEAANRAHNNLRKATQETGRSIHFLESSREGYLVLFDKAADDPTLYPLVSSGINHLHNLTVNFNELAEETEGITRYIGPVTNTTGTFSGSSDVAMEIIGEDDYVCGEGIQDLTSRENIEKYSQILRNIDPPLANTYEQVWEIYFGTASDKYRASLFMMRQLYDHFFDILAPLDDVRGSDYWEPKAGDRSDQVYRSERITYAAHIQIDNDSLADTMASSAKQIVDLYELANSAHVRGELNEATAQRALMAMHNILIDWLNAI